MSYLLEQVEKESKKTKKEKTNRRGRTWKGNKRRTKAKVTKK